MAPSLWAAPLLPGTQKQGMVMIHFPKERGETEEAGLVWGKRGVGCWTGPVCRTSSLPGWGSAHSHQESAAQPCPSRRNMVNKSGNSFLQSITLAVPDKDRKGETRPCQVFLPMDHQWTGPIQQPSPPLVEGNKGKHKTQHRGMCCAWGVWQTYHPRLCLMAGDSL